MRRFLIGFLLVASLTSPACGEGTLPAPLKDSGKSVLAAIDTRSSASRTNFPIGELSDQEVSTILWAASGKNRNGTGWTVPTAMGRDPYATIHLLKKDGAYRYDKKAHKLVRVSTEALIPNASRESFAAKASDMLVFSINSEQDPDFAGILVGAMSQNVYLACEGLGVKTRYMATLNMDMLSKALGLAASDRIVCIMPLGK